MRFVHRSDIARPRFPPSFCTITRHCFQSKGFWLKMLVPILTQLGGPPTPRPQRTNSRAAKEPKSKLSGSEGYPRGSALISCSRQCGLASRFTSLAGGRALASRRAPFSSHCGLLARRQSSFRFGFHGFPSSAIKRDAQTTFSRGWRGSGK